MISEEDARRIALDYIKNQKHLSQIYLSEYDCKATLYDEEDDADANCWVFTFENHVSIGERKSWSFEYFVIIVYQSGRIRFSALL